jgi:hypothetical protein
MPTAGRGAPPAFRTRHAGASPARPSRRINKVSQGPYCSGMRATCAGADPPADPVDHLPTALGLRPIGLTGGNTSSNTCHCTLRWITRATPDATSEPDLQRDSVERAFGSPTQSTWTATAARVDQLGGRTWRRSSTIACSPSIGRRLPSSPTTRAEPLSKTPARVARPSAIVRTSAS